MPFIYRCHVVLQDHGATKIYSQFLENSLGVDLSIALCRRTNNRKMSHDVIFHSTICVLRSVCRGLSLISLPSTTSRREVRLRM